MGQCTNMFKLSISFLTSFLALAHGQDTYLCPDGWAVADIGGVVDCILVGPTNEFLTKQDAEILCSFHDGWLVDMDEGRGGQKNQFVKELVDEAQGNNDDETARYICEKPANVPTDAPTAPPTDPTTMPPTEPTTMPPTEPTTIPPTEPTEMPPTEPTKMPPTTVKL